MANVMDSLRFMRSNVLNHLVESNVGSSRDAIKADLANKIVYDDPSVFRRIRVNQVNPQFVTECTTALMDQNADDIALLKDLVEQASKKSPDVLEVEEVNDATGDTNKEEWSGNHRSAEEKRMYDPLVRCILQALLSFLSTTILSQIRLFSHISTFSLAHSSRHFKRTNSILKADEPHTFGFPSVSPDITLAVEGVDASNSRKWCHRDAFGEVKPSKKQGPKPSTAGTISQIVIQCADYARLFMSARPFMLFCVGILIFGTEFCVGIFDRDGITFSPIYDMFERPDILVRVVRSMACNLSIEELGSDPTVRVLTDQETQTLTGQKKYPSAIVTAVGNDTRKWCTVGPPIWSSLSLLGRATNVWRVRQYLLDNNNLPFLAADVLVLKTAWRSSARTPESDIYLSIEPPYPIGLAEFICGGDVRFPGLAGFPITLQNLRSEVPRPVPDNDDNPTPVLHRLLLGTLGRPMWEYQSESDLLTGFRDALQAHRNLCDRGILHRDISAGNILLMEANNAPVRGFLSDLEFACVQSPTIRKREVIVSSDISPQAKYNERGQIYAMTETMRHEHVKFESTATLKRGAGMTTGTAQFMAREILRPDGPVVHQVTHDLESFIWVLSYCVMRSLQLRAVHRAAPQEVQAQCKAFRRIFCRAFGQTTPEDIAAERMSRSRTLAFPSMPSVDRIIAHFMSDALVALFRALQILLHAAEAFVNPTPLTHDAVLGAVNNAIELLETIVA